MVLKTDDVMVIVEGEHSCMTARGIKKPGTKTVSRVLCGAFESDPDLRAEVYSMLR